jgi:site-specific recombinase XerD
VRKGAFRPAVVYRDTSKLRSRADCPLLTFRLPGAAAGVHPHTLRHSCGFALADAGHDLRLIQDYLGHRDPRHTVHYTRTAGRRFEGLWGR